MSSLRFPYCVFERGYYKPLLVTSKSELCPDILVEVAELVEEVKKLLGIDNLHKHIERKVLDIRNKGKSVTQDNILGYLHSLSKSYETTDLSYLSKVIYASPGQTLAAEAYIYKNAVHQGIPDPIMGWEQMYLDAMDGVLNKNQKDWLQKTYDIRLDNENNLLRSAVSQVETMLDEMGELEGVMIHGVYVFR